MGVPHLYGDRTIWNKETKHGEHECKCIGRLDSDGREVFNEYYLNRVATCNKKLELTVFRTTLMGQNLIVDSIIRSNGIRAPLNEFLGNRIAKRFSSLLQVFLLLFDYFAEFLMRIIC